MVGPNDSARGSGDVWSKRTRIESRKGTWEFFNLKIYCNLNFQRGKIVNKYSEMSTIR